MLCLELTKDTRSLRVQIVLDGREYAGEFSVELPAAIVERIANGYDIPDRTHADGFRTQGGHFDYQSIRAVVESSNAVHVVAVENGPKVTQ